MSRAARDPRSVFEELLATVPPPRTDAQRRARRRRGPDRPRRPTGGDAGASVPARSLRPPLDLKLTCALPRELVLELRALCARQGVKQRRVVEQLVRAYVERHRRGGAVR